MRNNVHIQVQNINYPKSLQYNVTEAASYLLALSSTIATNFSGTEIVVHGFRWSESPLMSKEVKCGN